MLVACRLAGLSALDGHYVGIRALVQSASLRQHTVVTGAPPIPQQYRFWHEAHLTPASPARPPSTGSRHPARVAAGEASDPLPVRVAVAENATRGQEPVRPGAPFLFDQEDEARRDQISGTPLKPAVEPRPPEARPLLDRDQPQPELSEDRV